MPFCHFPQVQGVKTKTETMVDPNSNALFDLKKKNSNNMLNPLSI